MRKFTYLLLLVAMLCLPQWTMAKTDPLGSVFGLDHYSSALSSMCIGETYDANPVLYNHQHLPVTWSSSNEEYFTVDQNGIITPLKVNGDIPVYAYLRVHTDGDENYNSADDEIEVWIVNELIILPFTTAETIVTPENASDILGDGKLSFDYATHTLTMNNWVVNCPSRFSISKDNMSSSLFRYQYGEEPLTVNLVGTNTITDGMSLFDAGSELIFSGSGSLTTNGETMLYGGDQLTIDGTSLTMNLTTDRYVPQVVDNTNHYPHSGVFGAQNLSVINGGNFHATVSTATPDYACDWCFLVGTVGNSITGNILTEHVIWSNDPANEENIYAYFKMNAEYYTGGFFDDRGYAALPHEVVISGDAPVDTRADLDMYFQEWDYDLWQDVRITEREIVLDDWGYWMTDQLEFKCAESTLLPGITFTSSDEDIVEVEAEYDDYGERYLLSFTPKTQSTATITATFAGNAQYKPGTATLTVRMIDGKYYFPADLVFKEKSNPSSQIYDVPVDHLTVTEGETVMLPELCHQNSSYKAFHLGVYTSTVRDHFFFPWKNPSCTEVHCEVYGDRISVFAAGEDTLLAEYQYYDDEPLNVVKLPVTILPRVTPVSATQQTLYSFNTLDPATEDKLVFSNTVNDFYNSTSGQLEIGTTHDPDDVDEFINRKAAGTTEWIEGLQGSITLNLPAGKGTYYVECSTESGYEFKLKIRGQATQTLVPNGLGVAEISYDLIEPTAALIYLAATGAPAPKRAPAAKAEGSKGFIKSLSVTPKFSVEAKQDPDNAGLYYSTFYDSAKKYALPNNGTKAYVAKINSEGNMDMTEIATDDEVIPADVAVILQSPVASFDLTPSEETAVIVDPADNQLQGTDVDMAAPANCFVLSGHSTDNTVQGVGFYAFNGTLAAHKAYLIYTGPTLAPAHRMRFIFNSPTGLENASMQVKSEKLLENGQLIIIRNGVKYNAAGQIIK